MSAKPLTVFFSWQSDLRAASCRTLIQQALEGAAKSVVSDESVSVELVIDRDTQDVPGSPDIGATILSKIDAAAVLVADVTIVGATSSGKPTPNPNVLVELGYALKSLGWSRVLLVQNTAFGGPEALPFDLRQKRAIPFASPEDADERAPERRALQARLESALREVLRAASPSRSTAVDLSLSYNKKKITPEHHDYELVTILRNVGTKRIDDWEIEIEFPTALMDGVSYGMKVDERSNEETTFFRIVGSRMRKQLRPGDRQEVKIGYFINDERYRLRHDLFGRTARARALVDGEVVATVERAIEELQNF